MSLFHIFMAALQGMGAVLLINLGPDERGIVFVPFLALQSVYATIVMAAARRRGILALSVGD